MKIFPLKILSTYDKAKNLIKIINEHSQNIKGTTALKNIKKESDRFIPEKFSK